jgi:hypothetical protein
VQVKGAEGPPSFWNSFPPCCEYEYLMAPTHD